MKIPMRRLFYYLWAAPITLPAMAIGYACVALGETRIHKQAGVWEFYGGVVARLLDIIGLPGIGSVPAMTLGHVIWARNRRELCRWRRHEFVHVAQYERWGPLFVPVLYTAALWLALRGRHPYYDNPFEVEAYGKVPFPQAVDGIPRPAVAKPSLKRPTRKRSLLAQSVLASQHAQAPRGKRRLAPPEASVRRDG